MDLYDLKNGMFNGLDALQKLTFTNASHLRSVEMGILDTLNQTLKELRIESDKKMLRDLPIASFTGSKQTLNVEFVKIHYTMKRLTNKSFISLTKVKYFDLSDCNIQFIEEGTFDPIIDTVGIIQLANNDVKILPAGMFDSKPLNYQYTVVMVGERTYDACLCFNVPTNFFMWVKCNEKNVQKTCQSYLPRVPGVIYKIPTSTVTPTTSRQTSAPKNYYLELKEQESGDLVLYYTGTTKKYSVLHLSVFATVQNEHKHIENRNCTTGESNAICSWTIENVRTNTDYDFCVLEVSNPFAGMVCLFYKTKVPITTYMSPQTTSLSTKAPSLPSTEPPNSTSTEPSTLPLTESSTSTSTELPTSTSIEPRTSQSTVLPISPLTEPPSLPILISRVAEGTKSGDLLIFVDETTVKDNVTLILDVTNEHRRGSNCFRSVVKCYTEQSNRSCYLTLDHLQSNTKYTLCVADDQNVMKPPSCIIDRSLCVEYTTQMFHSQILLGRATSFLVILVLVSIVCVLLMIGFLAILCKD